MTSVVHIISATLREDVEAAAIDAAVEHARALATARGAQHVVIARSPQAILAATWIEGRDALEPFAASPEHMAFVMRGLAPCISGMWSAGVETEATPPETPPALLWVFGVRDSDTVYEWQIRDLVQSLDALPAVVAAGPTFEERDRYRAGGIACVPAGDVEAFRAALEDVRRGWGDIARYVAEASADVVASR